jgi:A/G-specific adenine glycosylase
MKKIIHSLSHAHQVLESASKEESVENGIDTETLRTFPFPIVIHNFIERIYRVSKKNVPLINTTI